jgi:hypothetical protein
MHMGVSMHGYCCCCVHVHVHGCTGCCFGQPVLLQPCIHSSACMCPDPLLRCHVASFDYACVLT